MNKIDFNNFNNIIFYGCGSFTLQYLAYGNQNIMPTQIWDLNAETILKDNASLFNEINIPLKLPNFDEPFNKENTAVIIALLNIDLISELKETFRDKGFKHIFDHTVLTIKLTDPHGKPVENNDSLFKKFKNIRKITEGGISLDEKYYVETHEGVAYFLRIFISNAVKIKKLQSDFYMLQNIFQKGVPIPNPIEFGMYNNSVYTLSSWVDGVTLERKMLNISPKTCYDLGTESGKILKHLHSISYRPVRKLCQINEKMLI